MSIGGFRPFTYTACPAPVAGSTRGGQLADYDVFLATRVSDGFQRQPEACTADGPEVGGGGGVGSKARGSQGASVKEAVEVAVRVRGLGFTLG